MSSPAEEDRKPNVAGASSESNEQIHIRVRCPDHEDVQFKIKKRTALSKVMDAYCSKPNRDRGSLVFLFDGPEGRQRPRYGDGRWRCVSAVPYAGEIVARHALFAQIPFERPEREIRSRWRGYAWFAGFRKPCSRL